MDFNPYKLYTQTYTQKYSHLNTEISKKYSTGTMTLLQHLASIISLWNNWKLENFGKIQTILGLKRQKIVRIHKTIAAQKSV